MIQSPKKERKLLLEIERLRSRLDEVEESLGAIQRGEVDALVVSGPNGDQIFTLQGAEHPYRVMVEAINEGAATLLYDGTLLYCNRQLAAMLHVPLEKLIGSFFPGLFSAPTRACILDLILRAKTAPVRAEVQLARGRGNPLPAYLSLSSFSDGDTEAVCLIATDLSDQKHAEDQQARAEQALREEEERHRLILSHIKDYAIFMLDPQGNVVSWDQGAERIKGYAAEEIIGRNFSRFYASEDAENGLPQRHLDIASADDRVEAERWSVRKDGSRFWANAILTSLRDQHGVAQGFVSVTRDITARKHAEEALRKLSIHLFKSQDQERRRIARELHDNEGQNLSVILMTLSKLKRNNTTLDEQSQGLLSDSIELTNQCLRDIRTLSYLLHPPLLDDFGLVSALRWYVEGFSQRSGVKVDLNLPDVLNRLPEDVETSLFRLVQESLTNIHRHSGSSTAKISLAHTPEGIVLEIEDYGKGFNARQEGKLDGLPIAGVGIPGMRERIRQLGGDMVIESAQGKTAVRAAIPIPLAAARASRA